ncbi:hypothetical protein LCGC14_2250290, partial [marine sediment metagenome]
ACVMEPRLGYLEQNARAITVLVVVPNGYGTGILIAPDKVLTVNHLLVTDKVNVYFYEGTALPISTTIPIVGEVIWRSDNIDLALLSISPTDISPAIVVCQLPPIGTPIFIIGHSGLGIRWTVRYGNVAASHLNSRDTLIIYMTTSGGDSGAGVFNYDGKLIGIIVARQISRLSGNDGFSFMIPGSKICEELVNII